MSGLDYGKKRLLDQRNSELCSIASKTIWGLQALVMPTDPELPKSYEAPVSQLPAGGWGKRNANNLTGSVWLPAA